MVVCRWTDTLISYAGRINHKQSRDRSYRSIASRTGISDSAFYDAGSTVFAAGPGWESRTWTRLRIFDIFFYFLFFFSSSNANIVVLYTQIIRVYIFQYPVVFLFR